MKEFFTILIKDTGNAYFDSLEKAESEAKLRAHKSQSGHSFFVMRSVGCATRVPGVQWERTESKRRRTSSCDDGHMG